jgi:hypothetical protein
MTGSRRRPGPGAAALDGEDRMAHIAYAFGASHSPMLTLEGKRWSERADDDMRNPSLTGAS